jgi:5-methylcytosine-specific restriction endonuclease McrA
MADHRTTTERGLGYDHQRQRARLLRLHRDGTPCWWCGQPMYRSQDLAADHTVSRAHGGTKADRLLHSLCNKARGDGTRDDQRPALRTGDWTSREW